jgi:hypothetical protein
MSRTIGLASFLMVVLLLCPSMLPALTAAQEPHPVDLQINEAQAEFPGEIEFHLEITTPSPIESVELEYGVEKVSCAEASVRAVPEVTEGEGQQVLADWTWDFRRSGSLPPGTRVWWRWHVTSDEGETYSTPVAWLSFDDNCHDWQSVEQGQINVHWYRGELDFGQEMLAAAVEAQARLTADPGANLERPIHIYFYATADELQDALLFSQRWTGGVAFTDYYTILVAASPGDQGYGRRTVTHELMHLVVHQLAFNCWSDLPRWLDEGLASWAEGDLEPGQQEMLDEAISADKLLSLDSLSGAFSAHADRASLSYAQSYSVIAFLIEAYGREKVLELLAVFREGATYDGALEQVYGFGTDGLEDLWRASIGAQPRPTQSAPAGDPTAIPTLALWTSEPLGRATDLEATPAFLSPTWTPRPTLTLPPVPTSTSAPAETTAVAPTAVAAKPSPVAIATRGAVAAPAPIGGKVEGTGAGAWGWYAAGGVVVLVGISLALMVAFMRHR